MPSARTASFRQLIDLLPEVDALEVLRIALARHAVTRADQVWADGERVATVDMRVLDREAVLAAVAEASDDQRRDTDEIYRAVGMVLIAEVEGDRRAAVLRLVKAGEEREAHGRYAAALRFFRAAAGASAPLADRSAQILAFRRIGRVQIMRGELQEAEQYYRQSLELAVDLGLRKDEVIARTGLGNLCARGGRWAEAESAYREALQRAEDDDAGAMILERAQLMNNLARATSRQERLGEARGWLEQADRLWSVINSPVDRAVWTSIHAQILWSEGKTVEACEAYEAAIRANPPQVHRAGYEIDLANLMAESGNLDAAWEWGRAAETSALAASAVGYVAHVYRGLGNVARASGSEAVAFYEKAIEIAQRYGLPLEEAETYIEYARLRAGEGNEEEAEAFLQRAQAICIGLGADREAREAELELERLRRPQGDAELEPSVV